MATRIARAAAACALVAIGLGYVDAQGSFSAQFTPAPLYFDAVLEQAVTDVQGGTLYAGSGIALSPDGLQRLRPYTMWCREDDLLVAYAEACVELGAPVWGDGNIVNIYFNATW